MREGLALLAQMRVDCAAWSRVHYAPHGEVGRDRKDTNAVLRLQLAWALQREGTASDAPLLRFALEEEVKWREEDPWQGVGETLEILAACTAQLRDVQDVWMFVRAKRANFDTECGFDRRHVLAAGVAKTLDYLQSSDHPDREAAIALLLDEHGNPLFDEHDLNSWHRRRQGQMPYDADERLCIWFERAMAVGRVDIASYLVDERLRNGPRDLQTLQSRAFDLESLERWREAIDLRKECFALIDDGFDQAGEACRIARLERAAGDLDEAQRWLRQAAQWHAENVSWRQVGLGRMFVEECFTCAAALGVGRGNDMFVLADHFAKETPRLPLVALEAAVRASEVLRNPHLSRYKQRAAREARRIEKIIK